MCIAMFLMELGLCLMIDRKCDGDIDSYLLPSVQEKQGLGEMISLRVARCILGE